MTDPTAYLFSLLPARWAALVLAIVAVCAVLDAVLPQPVPGSRWVRLRQLVSTIGCSWGWARNAVPAGSREAAAAHHRMESDQVL